MNPIGRICDGRVQKGSLGGIFNLSQSCCLNSSEWIYLPLRVSSIYTQQVEIVVVADKCVLDDGI